MKTFDQLRPGDPIWTVAMHQGSVTRIQTDPLTGGMRIHCLFPPFAHEQVINVPPDKTAKSAVNQKGSKRNMFFACREAAANHEICDYRKRIRQLESEIDYRRTVIEALQSQIDKLTSIHE